MNTHSMSLCAVRTDRLARLCGMLDQVEANRPVQCGTVGRNELKLDADFCAAKRRCRGPSRWRSISLPLCMLRSRQARLVRYWSSRVATEDQDPVREMSTILSNQIGRSCSPSVASKISLPARSHLMVSKGQSLRRNTAVTCQSLSPQKRLFGSSQTRAPGGQQVKQTSQGDLLASYVGPMGSTFYRLKLFSMGSLVLASAFTPVFLLAPAELGMSARVGLALTALATSGVSTSIVGWIGAPYVGKMSLQQQASTGRPAIVANTLTWRLQPLQTTIYEPSLIRPTSRPFANWELPQEPGVGATLPHTVGAAAPSKVLVAESKNLKTGKKIGAWWAETVAQSAGESEPAKVRCFGEGKPVRHFQVHEELLGEKWRILS